MASYEGIETVDKPIKLASAKSSAVLFYLAGQCPISLKDFASDCAENEKRVQSILQQRFKKELQIDQTGFVRITQAARHAVKEEASQILSEAMEAQSRGRDLRANDRYEKAAEQYQIAAQHYSEVDERLSTVGGVTDELKNRLGNVNETHDNIQKELAKDTLVHRKLLAEQREQVGDEALRSNEYDSATESYTSAINALEKAKAAITTYNERRLSSASPSLDVAVIDELINDIVRKQEDAPKQNENTGGDESEQKDRLETGPHPSLSNGTSTQQEQRPDNRESAPSREAVLEAMETHQDALSANPKIKTILEETSWNQSEVLAHFDSWDDALASANIDKKQAFLDDLKRTASKVEGLPTSSDQNTHGTFSSGMFCTVFDSWDEACAAANLDQSAERSSEPSSVETGTDEQPPDFAALEDLPANKRTGEELAIRIEEQLFTGAKRDVSLEVRDHDGDTIEFAVWSRHDLDPPEAVGAWYVVDEVRLQEWESNGENKRNLASSRGTTFRELGNSVADDTQTVSQEDSSKNIEASKNNGSEPKNQNSDIEDETKKSEPSDPSTTGKQSEDTEDGLLESIMDEFEDGIV